MCAVIWSERAKLIHMLPYYTRTLETLVGDAKKLPLTEKPVKLLIFTLL